MAATLPRSRCQGRRYRDAPASEIILDMDLIPVEQRPVAGALVQTCNARDLHAFLESGKDFSNWIKVQIKRARLIEGRDYVRVSAFAQKGDLEIVGFSGPKDRIEYHVTIEAGKHIGMMSNSERGFQIREYFLECERRALAAHTQFNGMATSIEAVAYEAGKRGAQDAIRESLPALVHEAALSRHGAHVPGWTAGDVVHEVVADMKGLRGLPQMVSRHLDSYHKDNGARVTRGYLGSNKACLFDEETCRQWLKEKGRALIERYVQMRRGQDVLPFIIKGKKKGAA